MIPGIPFLPPTFLGLPVRVETDDPDVQARFVKTWEAMIHDTEPGRHRPCQCERCEIERIVARVPRRRGMSRMLFGWLK